MIKKRAWVFEQAFQASTLHLSCFLLISRHRSSTNLRRAAPRTTMQKWVSKPRNPHFNFR
ncbi:MAG: hypothetical protein A2103_05615 [Gammaproteobacteria bacterium GWF2_41_13]|nr:MAG: hypothetical protein A2103_05615 [Gammaproteobacteria bacterium GWF2_41_13]